MEKFFTKSNIRIFGSLAKIIFIMLVSFIAGDAAGGIFFTGMIIFEFFYTILFGSIKNTIGKMVAARNYRGYHGNARQIFRYGFLYSAVVSILIIGFNFVLGNAVYGNLYGYSAIASISVFFGILFLLRSVKDNLSGYFYGKGYTYFDQIADIAYGVLLIALAPFIVKKSYVYGIKVAALLKNNIMSNLYGAIGAVLVECIATIVYIIILIVGFRLSRNMKFDEVRPIKGVDSRRSFMSNFFKLSFEIFAVKIFPIFTVFTVLTIYIHKCSQMGIASGEIFTSLGVYFTKYILVCMVPLIFVREYITRERDSITDDFDSEEFRNIRSRLTYMLKNVLYILVPWTFAIIVLAKPIVMIFFAGKMSLGTEMVKSGGILILFVGVSMACRTVLRSTRFGLYSLLSNLVGFLTNLLFVLLSLRSDSSIKLYLIGFALNYGIQTVILLYLSFKFVGFKVIDVAVKFLKIAVSTVGLGIVCAILDKFIVMNILWLVITLIIGFGAYFIILVSLRGISNKDINSLRGTLIFYPTSYIKSLFGQRF